MDILSNNFFLVHEYAVLYGITKIYVNYSYLLAIVYSKSVESMPPVIPLIASLPMMETILFSTLLRPFSSGGPPSVLDWDLATIAARSLASLFKQVHFFFTSSTLRPPSTVDTAAATSPKPFHVRHFHKWYCSSKTIPCFVTLRCLWVYSTYCEGCWVVSFCYSSRQYQIIYYIIFMYIYLCVCVRVCIKR